MTCVCGKGESTETCCGPILEGKRKAETAEELMRARYAAYALGNVDFIMDSHDPEKGEEVDCSNTEAWSKQSKWQGLEIVSTDKGGPDDENGTVEFVARYKIKGMNVSHHERAIFRKHNGRWVLRRRRRGRAPAHDARGTTHRPQRPVPVRQRQEVQEVLRQGRLTPRPASVGD